MSPKAPRIPAGPTAHFRSETALSPPADALALPKHLICMHCVPSNGLRTPAFEKQVRQHGVNAPLLTKKEFPQLEDFLYKSGTRREYEQSVQSVRQAQTGEPSIPDYVPGLGEKASEPCLHVGWSFGRGMVKFGIWGAAAQHRGDPRRRLGLLRHGHL